MALELLEADPHDKYNIIAIGWAVYSKAKAAIQSRDYATAKSAVVVLEKVEIEETDTILWESLERVKLQAQPERRIIEDAKSASKNGNDAEALRLYREALCIFPKDIGVHTALAWELQKEGRKLFAEEKPDILQVRRLLAEYMPLGVEKPPRLHSSFLRFADKIKDASAFNFIAFVKLWDLANLIDDDCKPYEIDGATYTGLAEKVVQHAAKIILAESITDAGWFLPHLTKAVAAFPENIWLTYYQAKILRMMGRAAEAVSFLLPVIKAKSGEYWTWFLMGELHLVENSDLALSCFCKALQCKSDEKFLANVRQKLAGILVRKSLFSEAKCEIEAVVQAKQAEHAAIPGQVTQWTQTAWYKDAVSTTTNGKFYEQNSLLAEELSFNTLPWLNACAGPIFQIPDRPRRFRRKVYVQADNSVIEATMPAARFAVLKNIVEGTAISIKGERSPDAPFQIYLAASRDGASETYDIFSSHNANAVQILLGSDEREPAVRIAFQIGPTAFESVVRKSELPKTLDIKEGQPLAVKAIVKSVSPGQSKAHILSVGSRLHGTDWDLYPEQIAVVDHINPVKGIAHFIVSRTVDGVVPLNFHGLDGIGIGTFLAVRLKKIVHPDRLSYNKLLACSTTDCTPAAQTLRKFSGRFERTATGWGFADDVFIENGVLESSSVQDGDYLEGLAVISYNKKKLSWGWKAIIANARQTDAALSSNGIG